MAFMVVSVSIRSEEQYGPDFPVVAQRGRDQQRDNLDSHVRPRTVSNRVIPTGNMVAFRARELRSSEIATHNSARVTPKRWSLDLAFGGSGSMLGS